MEHSIQSIFMLIDESTGSLQTIDTTDNKFPPLSEGDLITIDDLYYEVKFARKHLNQDIKKYEYLYVMTYASETFIDLMKRSNN